MREDVIVACEEIEAEILRTLTTKFDWRRRDALNAIEVILLKGIRVSLSGTLKVCRDPHDDMFLECAELAKAELLISGDKDLLVLGAHKRTRIISPAEYLSLEKPQIS